MTPETLDTIIKEAAEDIRERLGELAPKIREAAAAKLADEIERPRPSAIPEGYEEIPQDECNGQEVDGVKYFQPMNSKWMPCWKATRGFRHIRPIKEDKPDPYAELKKAHAEGKVIQFYSQQRGQWIDAEDPGFFGVVQYRIKPEEPWSLPRHLPGFRALRDGEEWHFANKWKQEWLPEGNRPLLVGEDEQAGDEAIFSDGTTSRVDFNNETDPQSMEIPRRTKRPLPVLTAAQVAESWIEWHGEENPVPGKRVVIMCRDGEIPEWQIKGAQSSVLEWKHYNGDSDIIAYRIIELKLIPLGPDDVPPGSVIRCGENHWFQAVYVRLEGVNICSLHRREPIDWNELKKYWQINRSIPMTGKWDATAWEPCSKPESKEAAE